MLAGGTEDKEHAMSQKLATSPAVIGIDIGKNSFHIVGQNLRGAIVLRQNLRTYRRHRPGCPPSSPLVNLEIEDVVKKDIRKDGADPRPLRSARLHRSPLAALKDAGLEPPLNQRSTRGSAILCASIRIKGGGRGPKEGGHGEHSSQARPLQYYAAGHYAYAPPIYLSQSFVTSMDRPQLNPLCFARLPLLSTVGCGDCCSGRPIT
jgi:hypothetical protein